MNFININKVFDIINEVKPKTNGQRIKDQVLGKLYYTDLSNEKISDAIITIMKEARYLKKEIGGKVQGKYESPAIIIEAVNEIKKELNIAIRGFRKL
jgi:hypothetical protein